MNTRNTDTVYEILWLCDKLSFSLYHLAHYHKINDPGIAELKQGNSKVRNINVHASDHQTGFETLRNTATYWTSSGIAVLFTTCF